MSMATLTMVAFVAAPVALLKVTADPNGYFTERIATNNGNWTLIRLPASGSTVTVLGWRAGCTLPSAGPSPMPTPTPTPIGGST